MASSPWQPPALSKLAPGLAGTLVLDTGSGPIQQAHIVWTPSYRIIASEYAGENLFDRLTSRAAYDRMDQEIADFREIADLTNSVVQHEAGTIELVPPKDRIWGPGSGLIMAAFAYPGQPSRFSDGRAGTYYATLMQRTAVRETCFRTEQVLRGSDACVTSVTVIEADLDATLVDLRSGCPSPPGVYDLRDYAAGQAFGAVVRHLEGDGITYQSVRDLPDGECMAVFRPPALTNVRPTRTLQYYWDGTCITHVC